MALIPKKPKKVIKHICPEAKICDKACMHKLPHYRMYSYACRIHKANTGYGFCPDCIEYVEPEPEMHVCPKADKCIMKCYHKEPHEYDHKYCNNDSCPTCVSVLISDVILFEEDFLL